MKVLLDPTTVLSIETHTYIYRKFSVRIYVIPLWEKVICVTDYIHMYAYTTPPPTHRVVNLTPKKYHNEYLM